MFLLLISFTLKPKKWGKKIKKPAAVFAGVQTAGKKYIQSWIFYD